MFFWTFYSPKSPEKWITFSTKYEAAQLFLTLTILRHFSWAANQVISMISEGSCDTEEWSNDAENSAFHYMNK